MLLLIDLRKDGCYKEHWADADKRVDECHIMEHEHAAHR